MINTPLFSLRRNGFEEITVHGELVVMGENGPLLATSAGAIFPARSLLKPFQFWAAEIPWERWGRIDSLRYTPCLGSLSATEEQVARLETWYAEPHLKALVPFNRVPASYPMDDRFRVRLKEKRHGPRPLFHTCFSKHMGILEGCDTHGWDPATYLSTDHPFHRALEKTLRESLGTTRHFETVTDGCGLPSPVMSLVEIATLYRQLVSAPADGKLAALRARMMAHPEWIGGPNRVDTKLMEANPGRLIAKEGADGLWGVAILPNTTHPGGVGIVLKLAAGYYPPLAALALSPVLEQLGLMPTGLLPRGQEIEFHYRLGKV